MPDDAWQEIEILIRRGDVASVVAALEPLDEPERRALAERARTECEERFSPASVAALVSTCSVAVAEGAWSPYEDRELLDRAVRSRSREWRQAWSERTLSNEFSAPWHWPIVHRMVKDGLIDRPAAREYLTVATEGMNWLDLSASWRKPAGSLTDALRGEPEWLAGDLWRLFELEESGLSATQSWLAGTADAWQRALCQLAAEGIVPRGRLLDASLAALRRDFSPYHARFHHKLYEALEPTPDEDAARLDELLALTASDDPAVVAFSVRALSRLERAKRLPADALFEAIAPALQVPVKGHAVRAVKLAGRVLKRSPEHAPVAVGLLVDALAHEARDVQEAALDIIETHRRALAEAHADRLAALAGEVDPSLRGRVQALAGARPEPASAGPAVAVPGRREPRPAHLADRAELVPVRDVGDLLDRAAVALERGDPDELELVLDGTSRLRDAAVDPGRARALAERAQGLVLPWQGTVGFHDAREALGAVLLRWLGGPEHRRLRLRGAGDSPREALAVRIRELLDELPGGEPRALLSVPTHAGGWIDPRVAVERIAALDGARPPVMDLAQMVLRLPAGERDPSAAERLEGEAGAVLARALGGNARRPLLTKLGAAWDAADHARDPGAFALPDYDLGDYNLRWSDGDERPARAASPAALLTGRLAWWGESPGGIERWLTTVWPANREPLFQILVRRLWLTEGTRLYGTGEILEVLLDPSEPIGEQAALAVALGLGTEDTADRTLAVDVTIAALGSRRLDGEALGAALARLLREQSLVVPARWAGSLGDVAAAGPLTAHDVQAAIEVILAAAIDADRRRLLGVVELLRRLALEADAAVADPGARAWLEGLPPRSKGGKAARDALAVTGDGAARSRAAAALA